VTQVLLAADKFTNRKQHLRRMMHARLSLS